MKNKHVKRWNEFNTWNYLCFSLFMLQIVNKCCMEWIKLSVAVIFLIQCRVTLSSLTKCIHHNEFSSGYLFESTYNTAVLFPSLIFEREKIGIVHTIGFVNIIPVLFVHILHSKMYSYICLYVYIHSVMVGVAGCFWNLLFPVSQY